MGEPRIAPKPTISRLLMVALSRLLGESGRSFAQASMKPQLHIATLVLTTLVCGCDQLQIVDPTVSKAGRTASDAKTPATEGASKVVSVTAAASDKMKSFLNGDQKSYIRLSVKNDGPTGFMYDLKIDDAKPTDSDIVDDSKGFALIMDTKSSLYLDGATIDWETRPDGSAGFKFDNPNAIEQ